MKRGHGSISYLGELNIDFIFTSLSFLLISSRQSRRWQSISKQTFDKYQQSLLFPQEQASCRLEAMGCFSSPVLVRLEIETSQHSHQENKTPPSLYPDLYISLGSQRDSTVEKALLLQCRQFQASRVFPQHCHKCSLSKDEGESSGNHYVWFNLLKQPKYKAG